MLVAALNRSAEAVHTLIGLLFGKTLEGDLDGLALFLEEIIVSASRVSNVHQYPSMPKFDLLSSIARSRGPGIVSYRRPSWR